MSTHETIQHQQPDQETSSQQRPSSDTADSDNRTTHDNNDQEKGTLDKEDYNDSPPDGGYGWFIVLAAFLSLFAVFGTNISWGKSCMMP